MKIDERKIKWVNNKTKEIVIERMIELHLKPRPKWLPIFIWRGLVGKLLILKLGFFSIGQTHQNGGEDVSTNRSKTSD